MCIPLVFILAVLVNIWLVLPPKPVYPCVLILTSSSDLWHGAGDVCPNSRPAGSGGTQVAKAAKAWVAVVGGGGVGVLLPPKSVSTVNPLNMLPPVDEDDVDDGAGEVVSQLPAGPSVVSEQSVTYSPPSNLLWQNSEMCFGSLCFLWYFLGGCIISLRCSDKLTDWSLGRMS